MERLRPDSLSGLAWIMDGADLMAGDWMKVEKDTPEKPEILALAGVLEITSDEAFGKCFRFWRWADSQLVKGNAPSVTKNAVNALVGCVGFAEAMVSVGWLEFTEQGMTIPGFESHMSQSAKARALTSKRVSEHKRKGNAKGNGQSVTEALPREEKRIEEIKEPPYPLRGTSIAFQMAWDSWPAKQRSKKETSLTAWGDAISKLVFRFDGSSHRAEDWLLGRVKAYVVSPRARGKYCRGIAGWLTEGNYDDPAEAWEDSGENSPQATSYPEITPA